MLITDQQEFRARKIMNPERLGRAELDHAIQRAAQALRNLQQPEGYWSFELEADCTIPAEYILMMHFMDEIDEELQSKLAVYLRAHQGQDGGWPLYYGGAAEISCSVKAYCRFPSTNQCRQR